MEYCESQPTLSKLFDVFPKNNFLSAAVERNCLEGTVKTFSPARTEVRTVEEVLLGNQCEFPSRILEASEYSGELEIEKFSISTSFPQVTDKASLENVYRK